MDDWFEGNGDGRGIDVAALMDSEAGLAIWTVVGSGALVSLGLTSDGGALGVTVTVDGRWRREYFRGPDDLVSWLSDGLAAIEAAVARSREARGVNGKRKRL